MTISTQFVAREALERQHPIHQPGTGKTRTCPAEPSCSGRADGVPRRLPDLTSGAFGPSRADTRSGDECDAEFGSLTKHHSIPSDHK